MALLAEARSADAPVNTPTKAPKAVIVPHAGYVYSGSTAALAFARLESVRHTIRRVVLLGPVHRARGSNGLPPRCFTPP